MIGCNFDETTHRGTFCNHPVKSGEYQINLPLKDCADFVEHPTRFMWDGSKLVEWTGWAEEEAVTEAAAAKARAEQEIRSRYAKYLRELVRPYSDEETRSHLAQEGEALQWQADNAAPCPMIRAMAVNRGITVELMVTKILENATLYRVEVGRLLGLQQKELDELYQ